MKSDHIAATLDEIAAEIKGARTLEELRAGLEGFWQACRNNASQDAHFEPLDMSDELAARGIELTNLPIFGGEPISDDGRIYGVWSWDKTHRLLSGVNGGFVVEPR